jgi:hypothetical protein
MPNTPITTLPTGMTKWFGKKTKTLGTLNMPSRKAGGFTNANRIDKMEYRPRMIRIGSTRRNGHITPSKTPSSVLSWMLHLWLVQNKEIVSQQHSAIS